MKKFLLRATLLLSGVFVSPSVSAQCTGGTLWQSITPTAAWQVFGSGYAGEYQTFTATAGVVYEFSYCPADGGSASYDTELTILNNSGVPLAHNDDFCSVQSRLTWTCTASGTYRILTNEWPCASNFTVANLAYRTGQVASNGPDGEMNSINYPSPYVYIPTSQVQPWTFTGGIIRNAGNTSINTFMRVNVRNGQTNALLHTANSPSVQVAVGANSTALTATGYTPVASPLGHLIEYVSVTGNDVNTSNDSLIWAVLVTDSVYGRDNNVNDQTLSIGGPGQYGTMYQIYSQVQVKTVSVFVANNPFLDPLTMEIRNFSGTGPGTVIATATNNNPGAGPGWVTVVFANPVTLNPGQYFLCMNDPFGDLGVGNSAAIFSPAASYYNLGTGWSDVSVANFFVVPMMRLNVSTPCPSISSTFTTTPANCGASTGGAQITVTGGTNYSYNWSNGQTGAALNNVTSGAYSVTVTHSGTCSQIFQVTVPGSPAVSLPPPAITQPLCNGAQGTITASPSGGTAPFTYSWSNGATGATLSAGAGSYSVTVTDASGCTAQAGNLVLTNPNPILISITNVSSPACGASNGSASAVGTGGTGTLTYQWSNGQTGQNLSNVSAGTYVVTVTDANNCTNTASAVLTSPNAPVLSNPIVTPPLCNGGNGTISVTATGGSGQLQFTWSNNATGNQISAGVGVYNVTVTDANNCSNTSAPINMTEPAAINALVSATGAGCPGGGNATATVSGGTPGYTYLWSNGANQSSTTNLSAGPHSVVVTDANGCSTTVNFTVNSVTAPTVSGTIVSPALCFAGNGSATVQLNGGQAPFSYAWSNGSTADTLQAQAGSYSVVITDANNCTVSTNVQITEPPAIAATFNSTPANCGAQDGSLQIVLTGGNAPYNVSWSNGASGTQLTGLGFGSYTANVTDANNCPAIFIGQVANLNAPVANPVVTDAPCFGQNGTIDLNLTGGAAPLTVLWNQGSTGPSLNAPSGTYTAVVTDAAGCQLAAGPFIIGSPALIQLSFTSTDASPGASNGSATVTVAGGTAPYTYSWNNGGSTATINNLPAGLYVCLVTDSKGCLGLDSVFVNTSSGVNLENSNPFVLYPNPSHAQTVMLVPSLTNQSFKAMVMDMSGRAIMNHVSAEGKAWEIPAHQLPAGAYLVQVEYLNVKQVLRMVVH